VEVYEEQPNRLREQVQAASWPRWSSGKNLECHCWSVTHSYWEDLFTDYTCSYSYQKDILKTGSQHLTKDENYVLTA
jgi:hypothetical protein